MNSNHLKSFFLFLLIFIFGSACGSAIEGEIFLDANNDLERNDGEVLLANLPFSITLDDIDYKTGQTNASGTFEIDVDDTGTYCITVNNNDLLTSSSTLVVSEFLTDIDEFHEQLVNFPVLELEDSTNSESCSDGLDNDNDGDIDCDDSDCSAESACSSSDGSTDDSSDDSDSDTTTIESGKVCKESSGGTLEIDVPISIDYSAKVSDLDNETINVNRDSDSVSITFQFPKDCTFNTFNLPDFLILADSDIQADAVSGTEIDLNEAIDQLEAENVNLCTTQTVLKRHQNPLKSCPIPFAVDTTQVLGDTTGTFTPTVFCPDDKDVSLPTFTISYNGDDDIDIISQTTDDNSDGTFVAGEDANVIFTFTNNTDNDFLAANVDLTLTIDSAVGGVSVIPGSGSCSGNTSCSFALGSGNSVVVNLSMTLPDPINETTTFDFSASLEVTFDGETKTFTEDASITVLN